MSDAPPFPMDDTGAEPLPPEDLPGELPHCPRCGSIDLGRGYVLSDNPNFRPAHFAPKGLVPRRARRMVRIWRNVLEIEAKVCRDCGYLMLGVDPKKLKKVEKKYPAR